jgi:hypothetical protein
VKIGLKGAFDALLIRKKSGVLGLWPLDGTLILALIAMAILLAGVSRHARSHPKRGAPGAGRRLERGSNQVHL